MSWDVYLQYEPCEACGRSNDYFGDLNYTSNMFPMLVKAGFNWDMAKGKSGAEARLMILGVIHQMQADPSGYQALNPENKWGDYGSFIRWLQEIADKCAEHPKAKFDISR